ncbi:MAG: TorF family putative porin [Pseudomonadota bacterium]
MKPVSQRLLPLCLGLLALGAQAQSTTAAVAEPAPAAPAASAASALTANVTLASQYISRGFRQTWGKPALQGGADYAFPNGFSVGTWLSTMSNRYIENGTLEWDLYGAYTGAAGDLGYSAAVYYYKYPGAEYKATATKYDYSELSFGASYKMLYAKYNYTISHDFFGIVDARGTGYLDIGANVDLGGGYTLNLHAGDGRVANNSMWNWRDLKVGVSKSLPGGFTLAAAYTKAKGATSAYDNYTLGIANSAGVVETSNPADGTLVLSLTKTF